MTPAQLDAIKSRLAAATSGPWVQAPNKALSDAVCIDGYDGKVQVCRMWKGGNATLIANAPTDIAALLAEVERLRTMSTVEMMCENESVRQHVVEWEARCLKAEAEVERLRESVGSVLSDHGCSCDCGCDQESHRPDCQRCLACCVEKALEGGDK
jgi:hypothetical protein